MFDTQFLSREYVALALIEAKSKFFKEEFITTSEFNHFILFLQKKFNDENLNIIITSNSLNRIDFSVKKGIITLTDRCCYNLDNCIVDILRDTNLLLSFFLTLEKEKLETLEKMSVENKRKLYIEEALKLTPSERDEIKKQILNKNCLNCTNSSCTVCYSEKIGLDEFSKPQGSNCLGWENPELVGKMKLMMK